MCEVDKFETVTIVGTAIANGNLHIHYTQVEMSGRKSSPTVAKTDLNCGI